MKIIVVAFLQILLSTRVDFTIIFLLPGSFVLAVEELAKLISHCVFFFRQAIWSFRAEVGNYAFELFPTFYFLHDWG